MRVHTGAHHDGRRRSGSHESTGGNDGLVQLWDARTTGSVGVAKAGSAVYALAATSEGSDALLLSAGYDGGLKLWDARALRETPLANLQAHQAPVRSRLVNDGAVWSGSTDGTVRCWDLGQMVAPALQGISPGTESAQQLEQFMATGAVPHGTAFISP